MPVGKERLEPSRLAARDPKSHQEFIYGGCGRRFLRSLWENRSRF
jgi:hypothetical protein